MHYTKKEVMDIVKEMLTDEADGLYIHEEAIESDLPVEDYAIYCNAKKGIYLEPTDKIDVKCGMSKVVLIPKDTDYVIKMPFTGVYGLRIFVPETSNYRCLNRIECTGHCNECHHEFCQDEDYEEGEEDKSDIVVVGESGYDFCDYELSNYICASNDLKKLLAEIAYIGEFNGIPIYVQAKVKWSHEKSCHSWKREGCFLSNEVDYISEHKNPGFYDYFIQKVVEIFGFTKALFLMDEIGDLFGDIHSENYGYTYNDDPIIFDYSDYEADTYSIAI